MVALLLLVGAAFGGGLLAGTAMALRDHDRLSDGQLAAVYRREHQRQLDGRAAVWE